MAAKIIFLVGWIALETIRAPHRKRNRKARKTGSISDNRMTPLEIVLMVLGFIGMDVLPLVYIFTGWLDFANYHLPDVFVVVGAALLVLAVWLLYRAHVDLGKNWSPTLEIRQEHTLVTNGVYAYLRHPIYAAVWLTGIAQALLLQNWIAGLALLVTFAPIYMLRVPREERMMLENFGEQYRLYMQQTGGVIPKLNRTTAT